VRVTLETRGETAFEDCEFAPAAGDDQRRPAAWSRSEVDALVASQIDTNPQYFDLTQKLQTRLRFWCDDEFQFTE